MDSRILDKYNWSQRHILRVFNEDLQIKEELYKSGLYLNDLGVRYFEISLKLLAEKEKSMKLKKVDNQYKITEHFSSSKSRTYACSTTTCECSFFIQNGCPCRHILLLRKKVNVNLFDSELFKPMFYKLRDCDMNNRPKSQRVSKDLVFEYDPLFAKKPKKIKSSHERYTIIKPLADKLVDSLVQNSGTKKMDEVVDNLENLISNVRSGDGLISAVSSDSKTSNSNVLKWFPSVNRAKVGRPKESKTSFLKKKTNDINITTTVNTEQHDPNLIICSFPPISGSPRQNAILYLDLEFLAPRKFVSDVIIDFKLRFLQPNGPSNSQVWIISAQLGQLMQLTIRLGATMSRDLDRLSKEARLFENGGCRVVFLPWCESHHFFAVVAIIAENQITINVMESLGHYGIPAGAKILGDYLNVVRSSKSLQALPIKIVKLDSQYSSLNNCAFFLVENAKMIMNDTQDFLNRASDNSLTNWYDPVPVENRRKETAEQIINLALDQRKPGGLLESESLFLPDFMILLQMGMLKENCSKVKKQRIPKQKVWSGAINICKGRGYLYFIIVEIVFGFI